MEAASVVVRCSVSGAVSLPATEMAIGTDRPSRTQAVPRPRTKRVWNGDQRSRSRRAGIVLRIGWCRMAGTGIPIRAFSPAPGAGVRRRNSVTLVPASCGAATIARLTAPRARLPDHQHRLHLLPHLPVPVSHLCHLLRGARAAASPDRVVPSAVERTSAPLRIRLSRGRSYVAEIRVSKTSSGSCLGSDEGPWPAPARSDGHEVVRWMTCRQRCAYLGY